MKILKFFGRGIIGIIIWPIATLFSAPKMTRLFFDREISLFHTTCDLEAQQSCCLAPCMRRIDRTRPSWEALSRMEQLQIARYRLPLAYIDKQKYTIASNLFLLVFTSIGVLALALLPNETHIIDFLKPMGWVFLAINGFQGFNFCVQENECFPGAIEAISMPIKSCFSKKPRYLLHESIMQAAVQTQSIRTIRDLVQSSGKADLNQSLIEYDYYNPKKLETHHKILLEATPLPDSVIDVITQYSFSPFYIGLFKEHKGNNRLGLESDLLLNKNIVVEIDDEDEKEDEKRDLKTAEMKK